MTKGETKGESKVETEFKLEMANEVNTANKVPLQGIFDI